MTKNSKRHPLLATVALAVVFAVACDISAQGLVPFPTATATPLPKVILLPTVTPFISPTALATPTPTSTPTPAAPPGVYAISIRPEPPAPRGVSPKVTFYTTFLNTTPFTQTNQTIVRIYRPENPNRAFGETARVSMEIPPGTSELPSASNWTINPRSCLPFVARVFGTPNIGGNLVEFQKPDGSGSPVLNFEMCP